MVIADDPNAQTAAMDASTVQQWLLAFAEQTADYAIVLLDLQFNVLWVNPATTQILGLPATQMIGRPLHRFFTPEDIGLGIPEHEIAVAISQGSSDDDRWMARADGSQFWASGRTVALSNNDGVVTGFLKILRNETETKMRINTLNNRVAALEAVDRARVAACAMLSHELRNPLSALGMAATALDRMSDHPPLRQPIAIIQRNVGFVARMVDDLEQASRATVGKLALSIEPLQLNDELGGRG
jgi:two-component system CheB/CheR fusion protein